MFFGTQALVLVKAVKAANHVVAPAAMVGQWGGQKVLSIHGRNLNICTLFFSASLSSS